MTSIVAHPATLVNSVCVNDGADFARFRAVPFPQGRTRTVSLAQVLEQKPAEDRGWWSVHVWRGSRRQQNMWEMAHGVVVDIDFYDTEGNHAPKDQASAEALAVAILSGDFEANIYHDTPRGVRLVYVFERPIRSANVWTRVSGEIFTRVSTRLHSLSLAATTEGRRHFGGFKVDESVQFDRAKLIYAPNAIVDGYPRFADVVVLDERDQTVDRWYRVPNIGPAVERFNREHASVADEWPRSGGDCPICDHRGCFGQLGDVEGRWACFSADHGDVGVEGNGVRHGDVLDVLAHQAGLSRLELLEREGYFAPQGAEEEAAEQAVREITEIEALLQRYALVEGSTNILDTMTFEMMKVDAFKLRWPVSGPMWIRHAERRVLRADDIVFRPQGARDGQVNLFRGLPSSVSEDATPGVRCARIIAHLYYLCGGDADLTHDLTCWLAYPLQNVGAKLGYAYVFQGPEGSGKSAVFEKVMMRIYGHHYGIQIGQTELESRYTGWLSRKLYIVCNEVSSSIVERKLVKNRLKSMITDDLFTIEEKFVPIRMEENHANLVFLSNEMQPVMPSSDDRRYAIVETKSPNGYDYYDKLFAEIDGLGTQAFYDYLMAYDLKDYRGIAAKPPKTRAKDQLIDMSKSPQESFVTLWKAGDTVYPYGPCYEEDLWQAYQVWSKSRGHAPGNQLLFNRTMARYGNCTSMRMNINGKSRNCRIPNSGGPFTPAMVQKQADAFAKVTYAEYLNYFERVKI